ncbi:MAG TPA: hypothetical protein P5205_05565 [Candidatus Paceibacterota bacterium]|nr:hypothetical protein [Verrucomicrobiota bacterium]HSA09822.1 hypothetical protein [Candidatus Paceibacterota bacterium]
MKPYIIRRVPYLLRGTSRIVWGIVLCETEGLALLWVQTPDNVIPSIVVIATESVTDKVFVDVNVNTFAFPKELLMDVGGKMKALGQMFVEEDFKDFFKPDTLWPDDD